MAGRYDITIEQGASFSLPITLNHYDNTAYNLTGYTGRGQLRRYHRSTDIIVSFTVTIDPTPTTGRLIVSLTAVQTGAIPAGEEITDTRSKYVYDLELEKTSAGGDSVAIGTVKRVLEGTAYVSPEVTR